MHTHTDIYIYICIYIYNLTYTLTLCANTFKNCLHPTTPQTLNSIHQTNPLNQTLNPKLCSPKNQDFQPKPRHAGLPEPIGLSTSSFSAPAPWRQPQDSKHQVIDLWGGGGFEKLGLRYYDCDYDYDLSDCEVGYYFSSFAVVFLTTVRPLGSTRGSRTF